MLQYAGDLQLIELMLAMSPFLADSRSIHIGSVPFFDGHIHLLDIEGSVTEILAGQQSTSQVGASCCGLLELLGVLVLRVIYARTYAEVIVSVYRCIII